MLTNREFSALAERYLNLVYRVAINCVGSPADADDVTQNTMLRLLRQKEGFQSEEHAKRWLIRVAVNESKRLLTAPWRRHTVTLEELAAVLPAEDREGQELLEAVLSLPGKYRLPLYLYYYEGYQVGEIGELLNRRPSTVQTQLARGRELLKKQLTEVNGRG